MADKQIADLVSATNINASDLFVLEQGGVAKKLTGQILINWLTSYADGHGGIQSITWTTSGTSGNGQLHTATIHYADATTSTFSIRDGYKGDKGDTWYFHVRYSANMPTANSDMGTDPDKYIGVYCGTSATAPTSYTSYTWYQWKGDKGDIGNPATLNSRAIEYQTSGSGTVIPEGNWSTGIPATGAGQYLWTRVTLTFNSGNPVVYYSVAYNGVNGNGAVSTVNNTNPDANGNVALSASNIPTSDNSDVQSDLDGKQNKITVQGMLKGSGDGSVTYGTKGTDYGGSSEDITLQTSAWTLNGTTELYDATVSNDSFFATSGFIYYVAPVSSASDTASRDAYIEAEVFADDVTTANTLNLHAKSAPESAITIHVARVVAL